LGALVVSLLAWLLLDRGSHAPANRRVLPTVDRARIDRIRLERPGQAPLEIADAGKTVTQNGVTLGPARAATYAALMDAAELAESRARVDSARPEFGLDPPATRIVFQPGGAALDI